MLTLDELALILIATGMGIVIAVGYARIVVGDTRPGEECVVCGEDAVFGREPCCMACGAFQTLELEESEPLRRPLVRYSGVPATSLSPQNGEH